MDYRYPVRQLYREFWNNRVNSSVISEGNYLRIVIRGLFSCTIIIEGMNPVKPGDSFSTTRKASSLILILMVLLVLVSCSETPDQVSPTSTGFPAPISTPSAEVISPTPERSQEIPSTTPSPSNFQQPLTPDGPWALLGGDGGVWAANLDGSGAVQLSRDLLYKPAAGNLQDAISPDGSLAAFVTMTDHYFHGMTLTILHFPDLSLIRSIPITSEDTEPPMNVDGGYQSYPYLAAGDFAWSPDGRMLAFTGLIEGETSDLYLYNSSDGSISRMTDGPTEAFQVSWSPDGKYILHFGAYGFGTGAGAPVEAAWLAGVQDNSVRLLYEPEGNGEYVDGWISPEEFVVHSWSAICGDFNFRIFNIQNGTSEIFYEGGVWGHAFDPQSGALLLVLKPIEYCSVGYTNLEGIYIVWPDNPYLAQVSDGVTNSPYWYFTAQRFILPDLGMMVSAEGETQSFPAEVMGYFAWSTPGGDKWAWTGTWVGPEPMGMWVGSTGQPPSILIESHVHAALWSPTGDTLLFLDSEGLFAAHSPGYSPLQVMEMNAREFALIGK
jgi:WD40 repeat protein